LSVAKTFFLFVVLALSATAQPTPLTMQLDLPVKNVQFAGLLVAERDGSYQKENLAVTLQTLGGDTNYENIASVVAASDHMVGSIESGLFLAGRAKGLPIVAIGTMFQQTPLCLISFRAAEIRTPKDLVGKRVCVNGDGQEALDAVLRKAGLNRSQLTVIEGDYGADMILVHLCDAKQGYLVDEFVELQTRAYDVTALGMGDNGYAAYSQVYFVSEATLAKHRAELVRFLAASDRGWRRAIADIPGTAQFVVSRYVPDLSLDYEVRSLRAIKPLLTCEDARMGVMKPRTWAENVSEFLSTRPEAKLGPMSQWVDFSLSEEAERAGDRD
jgi:ABC-type nitrate/sulfonate/bicarbonate transport system substrate-binding protein